MESCFLESCRVERCGNGPSLCKLPRIGSLEGPGGSLPLVVVNLLMNINKEESNKRKGISIALLWRVANKTA